MPDFILQHSYTQKAKWISLFKRKWWYLVKRIEINYWLHRCKYVISPIPSMWILLLGKSNPYCEVTMGSQCHITKTIQDTLNPKWNSNCQFFIKDLEQDVLCITVFERDQFSPDGKWHFSFFSLVLCLKQLFSTYIVNGERSVFLWQCACMESIRFLILTACLDNNWKNTFKWQGTSNEDKRQYK